MEHLRLIIASLEMADVRAQVALGLFADFENMKTFAPMAMQVPALKLGLNQVVSWSNALELISNPVALGEDLAEAS